jgi:hypothetical protein
VARSALPLAIRPFRFSVLHIRPIVSRTPCVVYLSRSNSARRRPVVGLSNPMPGQHLGGTNVECSCESPVSWSRNVTDPNPPHPRTKCHQESVSDESKAKEITWSRRGWMSGGLSHRPSHRRYISIEPVEEALLGFRRLVPQPSVFEVVFHFDCTFRETQTRRR